MNKTLVVLTVLLLAACAGERAGGAAGVPAAAPPTAMPAIRSTSMPTGIPTPTLLQPTASPADTLARIPTAMPSAVPAGSPRPTALPAPSPAKAAPRYVFPVRARKYSISSSHHDYPAADIACAIGSEFVAVTSGVVDYVSRVDRWPQTGRPEDKGGLSVAIVGDDRLRYYGSHLSEVAEGIEPGVRVEAGQLLGLTGETGNAAGVYPHLHFGISHPTTPDDWRVRRGEIEPFSYLRAWQRGEQVTPILTR